MTSLDAVYRLILHSWNIKDAAAFAEHFDAGGCVIGFDGSELHGREAIRSELATIFADHDTGRYVGLVREVQELGGDFALLRAVSGVIPAGASQVNPALNAVQSLVARQVGGDWHVVLYQNTPAAWHGRPELVEALTRELDAYSPMSAI